jgi:hypothetical protein
MRTLALPKAVAQGSLTSLREKLIKIGAKVISHGRYVTFQLAEVAAPREMFKQILSLIVRLRAPAHRERARKSNTTGNEGEVRVDEAKPAGSSPARLANS